MQRRDLASLAALAAMALTVGVGCPEDKPAGTTGAGPKPPATTKPVVTATATSTGAAAPAGKDGPMGNATIKGVVNFTGKAPEMKVPTKRKDAEFCKTKEVKYNAVVANDGKLQDVLVRIANGGVKGEYKAPTKHAEIDQVDCMYTPRIQGVVAGQEIDIKNGDETLHNVHTYKGTETWFNQAQPKGVGDPHQGARGHQAHQVRLRRPPLDARLRGRLLPPVLRRQRRRRHVLDREGPRRQVHGRGLAPAATA